MMFVIDINRLYFFTNILSGLFFGQRHLGFFGQCDKACYQEQLEALADSLVRFFIIDMQAQMARDQKEILLKVRRILSAVNKFPSHTVDASNPEENAILVWKQQIQVCLCPAILILSLSRCIYVCMCKYICIHVYMFAYIYIYICFVHVTICI